MLERRKPIVSRIYRKAKRLDACLRHRKPAQLKLSRPLVSFTFDDVPVSALERGGRLLESAGFCGTFYASLSPTADAFAAGKTATAAQLASWAGRGHEVGCHTYSHLNCARTPVDRLDADCDRNDGEAARFGLEPLRNFAYPYGDFDYASKVWAAARFESARSVMWGVNRVRVDLAALRAVPIAGHVNAAQYQALLSSLEDSPGWLIFYTHGVREHPSAFDCSARQLEDLIGACVDKRFDVAVVGHAMARCTEPE